jgi:hypothetical protein
VAGKVPVKRNRFIKLVGADKSELGLGLEASVSAAAVSARPLRIASSRMGHLWDGLSSAYDLLGFARAAGGDEAFRQLVLARIIEPTSKQDSLRVLAEVGVDAVSYPTLNRHLRGYAAEGFRRKLAAACAAHAKLGPASLVLYDVSTLYLETDAGDGNGGVASTVRMGEYRLWSVVDGPARLNAVTL